MKFSYSIIALALVGATVAAPLPIESSELVAKDAVTYTTYPAPSGGYKSYPAPAGGYKTYPEPSGGYKTYPEPTGGYTTYATPAGGYKTYKKAIGDLISRWLP
jgi:hypothetical protein